LVQTVDRSAQNKLANIWNEGKITGAKKCFTQDSIPTKTLSKFGIKKRSIKLNRHATPIAGSNRASLPAFFAAQRRRNPKSPNCQQVGELNLDPAVALLARAQLLEQL
jgi:hypothetical protein